MLDFAPLPDDNGGMQNNGSEFVIGQSYSCITGQEGSWTVTGRGERDGVTIVTVRCGEPGDASPRCGDCGAVSVKAVSRDSQGREEMRPLGCYDGCVILRASL